MRLCLRRGDGNFGGFADEDLERYTVAGSGPRCGLGELVIPENEPDRRSCREGESTQCEAMTMVCVQVHGATAAVGMAGSQGNFELNVYKPVIIYNFLHSVTLVTDACHGYVEYMVKGIEVDRAKVEWYVKNSLMLVTALAPKVGMTTRRRLRTRRMWSIRAARSGSETGTSYGRGIRCAGEAREDDASVENRLLS